MVKFWKTPLVLPILYWRTLNGRFPEVYGSKLYQRALLTLRNRMPSATKMQEVTEILII